MKRKQILKRIRDDVMLSLRFKEAFKEVAEAEGEFIHEPLPAKDLINIIIKQGYWSGIRYRIYWSLSQGFTFEEKRFGR